MFRLIAVAAIAIPIVATASFTLSKSTSTSDDATPAVCECGVCDDGCLCCAGGSCSASKGQATESACEFCDSGCDCSNGNCTCSDCECPFCATKADASVTATEKAGGCCEGGSCSESKDQAAKSGCGFCEPGCDCANGNCTDCECPLCE